MQSRKPSQAHTPRAPSRQLSATSKGEINFLASPSGGGAEAPGKPALGLFFSGGRAEGPGAP